MVTQITVTDHIITGHKEEYKKDSEIDDIIKYGNSILIL